MALIRFRTLELDDRRWPTTRFNKQSACRNQTISVPRRTVRSFMQKFARWRQRRLRHLLPLKDNYSVIEL